MTQEALKLALEALEVDAYVYNGEKSWKAITAIKEALAKEKTLQALHSENERLGLYKDAYAEPEQEPVALPCCGYADSSAIKWNSYNQVVQCHNCGQVYTHPQRTWVGLTDDEIANMFDDWPFKAGEFARVIEAKLKEKNFA